MEIRQRDQERLDREKQVLLAEQKARNAELDWRAAELDTLQTKLDDRNNTHVRREIRSSLMELTKERLSNFAVSKETRLQYWLVHGASLAGIVLLVGVSVQVALGTSADAPTQAFIAAAARSSLAGAAALALGVWYLKWLNRWLQRIADAEFKLQQFRLDIERASWLAETVLEWKQTSSESFPELLATRLSTGLFQATSGEVEDPRTPATQLAFDRKGLRRLDDVSG